MYIAFDFLHQNITGQKFAMMEEKVLLANLFRNFEFRATRSREEVILLAEIVLRPKDGLHVKIIPRL